MLSLSFYKVLHLFGVMLMFSALGAVISAVSIPVEIGGGLRSLDTARRYRDEVRAGFTHHPPPESTGAARREGWIHVPSRPLAALRPQ